MTLGRRFESCRPDSVLTDPSNDRGEIWREIFRSLPFCMGCPCQRFGARLGMGQRLIISDNRDDPGNPLVLDGEVIDKAAEDHLKIGQLMVDQVWAEGTDPTGGGLYYERNSQRLRRLQAFETGSEDLMTGGWVRVLMSADQVGREREGMEQAASRGLVRIHGTHRGVLLVEFLDVAWGEAPGDQTVWR